MPQTLRGRVIRLAHAKPELRSHLLPLLRTARTVFLMPDPDFLYGEIVGWFRFYRFRENILEVKTKKGRKENVLLYDREFYALDKHLQALRLLEEVLAEGAWDSYEESEWDVRQEMKQERKRVSPILTKQIRKLLEDKGFRVSRGFEHLVEIDPSGDWVRR